MPDFTIITPSYNYGHYIAQCLQSVASQQGVTIEHLVMDACSSDNTAEVVAEYPHASFIQEPDQGMSDAINKGFRKAKGTWVMWLNADDRLLPGALAAIKHAMVENTDADIIYGGWNFMDMNGNFKRKMTVFPFNSGMIANLGCYIASTSTFFRRETTIDDGFLLNIDFQSVMDGEWYCRLARGGKRFYYLHAILAEFRLHDKSISQCNLEKTDLHSILKRQKQFAETRAIRRFYGFCPFKDENLCLVTEGVVACFYRALKITLRALQLLQPLKKIG